MRIVIDLDGTICSLCKSDGYAGVKPNPGAADAIKELRAAGHEVIISTARHMKTCDGDRKLVVAKIGQLTIDWLKEHDIQYDEIHFGKQYANAYIDDLAIPFNGWEELDPKYFDEKVFNVVIPMAGYGSRFSKADYKEPKPMIDVNGRPMFQWAVESLQLENIPHRLFFIVLEEVEHKYGLSKAIKALYPTARIVTIKNVTRGQAETVLAVRKFINNLNKLIIFNCDTISESNLRQKVEEDDPDGIIATFNSSSPSYSYAKLNEAGYVTDVAEKEVISSHASTGLYYFKRGRDYVAAAEKMIEDGKCVNNEFYIMPVYEYLIRAGKRIQIETATNYEVLGTPADLDRFKSKKTLE